MRVCVWKHQLWPTNLMCVWSERICHFYCSSTPARHISAYESCWYLAVPTAAHSKVPHTQYMLLTHSDYLLCLQLHTVRSPYTVHASIPCWLLAVPTAAYSKVSIHSTCFYPMLMSYCAYSCTQKGLHKQHMLPSHADVLLCLQLHTEGSP